MNGKRAKILRKLVYGPDGSSRYRSYQYVDPPNRSPSKYGQSCIADEKRYRYQTLKGRRGLPAL